MADKATVAGAEVVLSGGLVAIDTDTLSALVPTESNARGLVLASDRRKVLVKHMLDGVEVFKEYTLQLYIQREALDDNELANVALKAKEQAGKKAAKLAEEQAKREREIAAATSLTRDAIFGTLRNIDGMAQGIRTLNAIAGK